MFYFLYFVPLACLALVLSIRKYVRVGLEGDQVVLYRFAAGAGGLLTLSSPPLRLSVADLPLVVSHDSYRSRIVTADGATVMRVYDDGAAAELCSAINAVEPAATPAMSEESELQ